MRPRPDTITPDRWKRIESLFEAALDRADPERAAFLSDAAQGDADLRSEVEALLAADQRDGTFIDSPIPPSRSGQETLQETQLPAGSRVGAYRIIGLIASGGMGRVYLAERTDRQFEKRVAVKVIKRGMDTDEVVRRFRAERQTLANLDHPHIARLLDGGMTEDNLPYLVMEFIEGRPIDVYCDEHRLSTHERLRLFLSVCAAVDYAHRNLVIHRDLKPANILVAHVGAVSDRDHERDSHSSSPRPSRSETAPTARPKVIDFGIAKVLDTAGEAGSSLLTLEGFRPMTPEYASPEQVRGQTITTASDVYSLGVILYELLTGHRPYRFETRMPSEMQRVICEQHPDPPSTVVGKTVHAGGPDLLRALTPETVSRTRNAHPRRLRRILAGDLDNIVLTALRKEPERRYASVRQLADDMDRYLAGLPVTARRDSWGYRTAKWIRRQPALAAMIALVVLTLVAGIVGTTWTAREAIAQRDAARRQRDRADLEARKARQINSFVQNMLASVHPERGGLDVTVREVLDQAAARIEADLAAQPLVEAEVRSTLGQAYHGLGLYAAAEEHLRDAVALQRQEGESPIEQSRAATHLASLLAAKGSYEEAASLLNQARELLAESAGPTPLDEAAIRDVISSVKRQQGAFAEAEAEARTALEVRRSALGDDHLDVAQSVTTLAALLQEKGDYAGADALYREAVDIKRRRLGEDHPSLALDYSNWGDVFRRLAKHAEAERVVRKAVEIRRVALGPNHPALATSLSTLGLILKDTDRTDEAESLFREALEINRKALGPDHPDLGGVLNDLAGILRQKRDFAGAEAMYREALRIVDHNFGRKHPHAASALHNLGRLFHFQGRLDEAEAHYREALDIRREVQGDLHPELAVTLNNLTAVLMAREDYAAAVTVSEEALRVRRAALPPGHPRLADSVCTYGKALMKIGASERAEPLLEECVAAWVGADPPEPISVARAQGELGECLMNLRRFAESEPLLLSSFERLSTESSTSGGPARLAAQRLVELYESLGQPEKADAYRGKTGE